MLPNELQLFHFLRFKSFHVAAILAVTTGSKLTPKYILLGFRTSLIDFRYVHTSLLHNRPLGKAPHGKVSYAKLMGRKAFKGNNIILLLYTD